MDFGEGEDIHTKCSVRVERLEGNFEGDIGEDKDNPDFQ